MLSAGVAGMVTAVRGGTVRQVFNAQVEWFYKGFFTAAAIYGAFWITHSLLVFLFGTSAGMGGLEVVQQYGIRDYDSLRETLTGTGYFAHHIIEQRFAQLLGLKVGEMASVAVTGPEHQMFTNAWRNYIPYITGTATATKELIWEKAQIIYAEYPALLETAKAMLGM